MPNLQKPPTVSNDERARRIYRRAAEVIHEQGFEATTMGDIADVVDLTKGGLYYYIKGKQALLYAIMSLALELLEEEVVAPALEEDDPESRLSLLVAGFVSLTLREPCAMSILAYEGEGLDEEHHDKMRDRKECYPQLLAEVIGEVLERQGGVSKIDPVVAAHSLLGMIQWIDRWYHNSGHLSDRALAAQLTRFALHGLVPRSPRASGKAPAVR